MNKKTVNLLLLAIFIAILVAGYKFYFKSWNNYYKAKLYKEPSSLIVRALSLIKTDNQKLALDLGAGSGNETAYLLNNNWHVWANDKEKLARKIISTRKDIKDHKRNLVLLQSSFGDLPWANLPKFDLIYAGYSLPFIDPKDFKNIWQKIIEHLNPAGVFAGSFIGIDHAGFNSWQKQKMTILSKEQLLNYFEDFDILFFNESNQINERGIQDHSLEIIARKKH